MSLPGAIGIERALAAAGHPAVRVHAFEELASTNAWLAGRAPDAAAAPAAGAPAAPSLCIADSQVRGSGRRGRSWQSRPGDITFSISRHFVSPVSRIAPLGLVTGVAVANALREATSLDVRVKWPNDLQLEHSKLGGLLVESRSAVGRGAGEGVSGCRAVGGIGINLIDAGAARGDVAAASLGAHGVPAAARDALVSGIAASVLDAWTRFDDEGWTVFEEDWRALDALEGRAVRVHEGAPRLHRAPDPGPPGDDAFDGVARGVDGGGALRVERPDGRIVAVHAGEVSVRPRA